MENNILILIIILLLGVLGYVFYKNRNKQETVENTANPSDEKGMYDEIFEIEDNSPAIVIEELFATDAFNHANLAEITDKEVISQLSDLVSGAVDVLTKRTSNKSIKDMELYKVIIPGTSNVSQAAKASDAVKGIYKDASGIEKQLSLNKIDPKSIANAGSSIFSLAAVMNIGAMVVGQYYMEEVSEKLENVSRSISKVRDFQEREFKSKILALVARVGKITEFSKEIIYNDDLRKSKLMTLEALEGEATQLIQQVNISIEELSTVEEDGRFKNYNQEVNEISTLLQYQSILLTILNEISQLTYLLSKGEVSNEMSYSIYNKYLQQSNLTRDLLADWHEFQIEHFNIDLENKRREKRDLFGRAQGAIREEWKYKDVSEDTVQKINTQREDKILKLEEPKDYLDKDVEIIVDDGKYYYLEEE
ncbi:hypothetical protein BG261_01645 [Floricoccus tropicus]|uniref:Topoisomerase IV n=1 Tax=Floricoccus tropicus TaxID=1859473 RepID=A0A1E8GM37_9LACT|nr:hypothetical protein [Floricoccus tropicus]OFI49311.1 hypothetical protein BG261_01645 [Floricoccus tropicus]